MRDLGSNNEPRPRRAHWATQWLALAAAIGLGVGAAAAGCGGSDSTGSASSNSGGSGGTGGTGATGASGNTSTATTGTGGKGGTGGTGGGTGGADAGPMLCGVTAANPTRGSAIALTKDENRLVVVNRDTGNAAVMSIDHATGVMTVVKDSANQDQIDLGAGSEPWSVAIDACGKKAYVVLRKAQKVVEINDIDGTPSKGAEVSVGSEPTAIAITPNNTKLYVANWVDGTLTVIDTLAMTVSGTVDLNATLAATGLLGAGVTARAAMAHPRAIAISNNGNTDDTDEHVYVTEWFAQRTAPEAADGKNSDTNKQGLVYKVKVSDGTATTIALPPVMDTGFNAAGNGALNNSVTGCFPNQVGAIAIENGFAYVTSTCASPVGPIGAFQKGTCTTNANCAAFAGSTCGPGGLCLNTCVQDADCGFGSPAGTCNVVGGTCKVNPNNFKTTTHPAVSVINLAADTATTKNIDKNFVDKASTRLPLLPTDIGFKPGTTFGYITAEGTDAVFRIVVDATGAIVDVGSAANVFINLRKTPTDTEIVLPVGIAISATHTTAFAANEGTREVGSIDLNAQAIFGAAGFTSSALMPPAASQALKEHRGKRFFITGLGRWSFQGAGWGSCAACHIDGLTDNVTWYFARGPRQSVSLDGSFASSDPTDQRIFNWTAIFDEVADFEGNIRGVSGGVGAIVKSVSMPLDPAVDRIDTAAIVPPQQGLQGSSEKTADPNSNAATKGILEDWNEVTAWIKIIRSPRKPTNLVAADVAAGLLLFQQGNCKGCHSGAKWTISKRFYTPDSVAGGMNPTPATNDASTFSLSNISWNSNLNGFPALLLPAGGAANLATDARMRFGAPPGAEQIQCILRPVGTIGPIVAGIPGGISPAGVNVVELRQDMVTGGQGAADNGRGFNPPSLLGLQVGAPYFHAGNARTLEEAFAVLFKTHYQSAIANIFELNPVVPDPTLIPNLVAYLLSIDEDEPTVAIPALGNTGGDICHL